MFFCEVNAPEIITCRVVKSWALLGIMYYPTLAREFQGFRVWGKFVFRTLELTDTPTNLANRVKVGHALDQSRSVQSRGPERAHQNNEPSWRSSRTDHRLSRQFWDDQLAVFTFQVWDKNKNPFWMASLTLIFTRSVELITHEAVFYYRM